MLIFEIENKRYTIEDNKLKPYNKGLAMMWEDFLSESQPSLPSPIDLMYYEMKRVGAKIIKYDMDSKEGVVY